MSIASAVEQAVRALLGPLSRVATGQPAFGDVEAAATALRRELPELRLRILTCPGAHGAGADAFAAITAPEVGTILVGAAPDDRTPWPLRSLRHAGETIALRVDGESVSFEDLAAQLEHLWEDREVLARIVDARLIANEISSRDIKISAEELQAGVDAFRMEHGLIDEAETLAWLTARGWSVTRLEDQVRHGLQAGRLRASVVSADDVVHAAEDVQAYRRVALVEATFDERAPAMATLQAIEQGESLHATARDVAAGLRSVRSRLLTWHELNDEERAVAARSPRVGVIEVGLRRRSCYRVVHVTEVTTPGSSQAIARAARDRCFAAWLLERRKHAHVEWLWGHAQ